MTAPTKDRGRALLLPLILAIGVTLPGITIRFNGTQLSAVLLAVLFGLAIVGAAFILSWAAEVAEGDLPGGLAIAILALVVVAAEYAVDVVFAAKAGHAVAQFGAACHAPHATGETACSLALANMTGANRLLIGIGWPLVALVAFLRGRKEGKVVRVVQLERSHAVELSFLAVATLYCLTLPLKGTITPIDGVVLVGIFVAYTIRVSKAPAEEPHLVGPGRYIGELSTRARRVTVAAMFGFAAAVILLCAQRFAEALVATGGQLGISQFLLVQWLAPIASETPELLVAALFAWRLRAAMGMGLLVSSKVNQWTLLVGSLPAVFMLTSGSLHGLPIGSLQRDELLLTAAQSVFAVAILCDLTISTREAMALLGLFFAQFIIGALAPESARGSERLIVSGLYLAIAAGLLLKRHRRVPGLLRDGFLTPFRDLEGDEVQP